MIQRFWPAENWNPPIAFGVTFCFKLALINSLKIPLYIIVRTMTSSLPLYREIVQMEEKNTLNLLHKSGDIYFSLLLFRCLHSQLSVCFLKFWSCIAVILTNISVLYLINSIIKDDIIFIFNWIYGLFYVSILGNRKVSFSKHGQYIVVVFIFDIIECCVLYIFVLFHFFINNTSISFSIFTYGWVYYICITNNYD